MRIATSNDHRDEKRPSRVGLGMVLSPIPSVGDEELGLA